MIARSKLASIALVSFVAFGAFGLAGCGSEGDPEPEKSATGSAALSADGGSNPADNAALADPNLVGASPVQPSPWDHLIVGAQK